MGSDLKAIYRFDSFTLDLIRGALLGPDGSELPLRPKSFALLRYVVAHAERLVDRDELMQAVWPGVFVTDDSIAQCVKDIRRALGDETQRLLRTIPRRGYLLATRATCIAQAEFETSLPATTTIATNAARPLPAPAALRPMLVVLPFENMGGDPEQRYLASGLTADLVTDLTRFEELHVVSPPAYAQNSLASGTSASGWTIPKEASYLFVGSVRRSEGHIRITIRLDDARTGVSLWAERFDRPLDELMTLQEELVEHLPSHLVAHIEREATRRARRRPAANLDAYDLCLRGQELQLRVTEQDTLAARALFDRAIKLDPYYATAHAWQAYTLQRGFTWLWGEPRGREAATLALTLARHAVELEPESSLCLGRFSIILMLNHEWEKALEVGRAAVRANPCAAESHYDYGDVLAHAGDPAEAEQEVRLALRLNPYHPAHWRVPLARALMAAGRWEEALRELHYCSSRMPHYIPCLQSLAAIAAETGHFEEAHAAVAAILQDYCNLTIRDSCERLFFRDPAMFEYHRRGFDVGGMPEG
jgi:TolB-like protein